MVTNSINQNGGTLKKCNHSKMVTLMVTGQDADVPIFAKDFVTMLPCNHYLTV